MKKQGNILLKASLIVTIISVLGKILGFARDAVIAAFYGADWRTDAFFFAQSMPSVIFPAVCNSLSTAFLSVYVTKSVDDNKKADQYGSKAITFSFVLAIVLSAVAIIMTPILVPLFAPGFSKDQSVLAIHLTRITMAAFVLIMAQYMLGAILSAKKLFYGAQIAALFYNLSVIIITIVLGKGQNMDALTYTVVIGHGIQIISLVFFARKAFKYSFSLRIFDFDTKQLVKLTLPIILGNSIVQINNIVDKVLSSLFGDGAMSALSYSNTLNRFVTGVVITTLSTVIYPILTEQYSKNEKQEFSTTIRKSISLGLIGLLPVSIITTICADDIVCVVYQRGEFDENATKLTSYALMFYGMMFVFAAVQEIITRAFYGMKDTKTPLKTASIAIISNALFSIFFSRVLGMGLGGIALGTTLSSFFAAALLLFAFNKRVAELQLYKIKKSFFKIVAASILTAALALILKHNLGTLSALIRFSIITISCFIFDMTLLLFLKCEEITELCQKLIYKIRKPS